MEKIEKKSLNKIREYCKTRDPKLRNEIILERMPQAERIVLSLGITDIEKDDLIQIAYEELIRLVNNIKNPEFFNTRLGYEIMLAVKKYKKDYETTDIRINDIDVYSNNSLEERIAYDSYIECLLPHINEELSNSVSERNINVFNKVYDASFKTLEIVGKEFNVSRVRIGQIEERILRVLRHHALFNESCELSDIVRQSSISFYRDCDNIEDSHAYVKK